MTAEKYAVWTVIQLDGCLKQVLIHVDAEHSIEDCLVPNSYKETHFEGCIEIDTLECSVTIDDVLEGH